MPSLLLHSAGNLLSCYALRRDRAPVRQLLGSLLIAGSLCNAPAALSHPAGHAPVEQTQAAQSDTTFTPEASTPERSNTSEGGTASSSRVPFPEAGITLIPPPDFQSAELFDGFQQEDTQASILVLSFPAPTDEIVQAFGDSAALAERGMTLIDQETIDISGQSASLIQLEQEAHGLTFGKWVLIFGDDEKTVLINANFPKELAATLSAPIKNSLLSTQIDDSLVAPDVEETSDFTITPVEGIDLALNLSGTLLYSPNGEINSEDPTAPLFIISPSFSGVSTQDLGQFSRDRLQQTTEVEAISILDEAPITIDGLEGYEITATAQDRNTGVPLLVYQTILFAENRYYIMQGLVGEQNSDPHLADFKTMAESFQRQ